MSVHLRARDLGVLFRHHVGHHEADAGGDRLGGTFVREGRHRYLQALDGVDFDLAEGDRLALVGHNGAGKTTLLRALAGIYPPHRGRVESRGRIASLFNLSLGFRPEASGYRNIVLKGLMDGRSRQEIDRAIPEIIAFSGLGAYIDMPLHTYSQGMAMRLAFSIATSFANDILLMDEWIGTGDAAFREKVVARMNDFVRSAGIVVIASHSTGLLKQVANRAIWLEAGRVRAAGTVEEVVGAYESDLVSVSIEELRADLARLPPGQISLGVRAFGDGSIGEVCWDTGDSGIRQVQIVVIGKDGRESMFATGGASGTKLTGKWLRPGFEFRLLHPMTGDVLATTTVTGYEELQKNA